MKTQKRVALILSTILALTIVAICTFFNGETTEKQAKKAQETITVVDHTGIEVEIPKNPRKIVISSILPLPSVYCFFRGSTEGLIGMHPSSMAAAENSYLTTVYPEITKIDTSFVENGEINIEQLMKLEPDVVFYSASEVEDKKLFDSVGIPAVGFSTTMANYNTIETYANWIELLGEIFGESGKSNEIIEYGRSVEKDIITKTSKISDQNKPRALILFNYGNGKITTSGSEFFGQYWIESAGGINVASELKGQSEINMEQIYEWNPDMIFITNFSSVLPEDILNNKIEGNDWSRVKAVQDKKVYKFPLGMYRWFPPSSDTPLALMWMAKTVQPRMFDSIDMDKEIRNYYSKYYNTKLGDEDIETIYNPAREAAGN